VKPFEAGLLRYVHDKYPDVVETIRTTKALGGDVEGTLKKAVTEFAGQFSTPGYKQYDTGKNSPEEALREAVTGA
jgi:hypothetical protein